MKIVKNISKLVLASGILYWLIKNGKLDPKSALQLFSNFSILLPAMILLGLQVFTSALRWMKVLQIKSNKITDTKRIFLIQWIGQFFSSALPGVITGDLIKLSYVISMDEKLSKKFLLLSLFLDRLLGLIGLLLISGISSLIFYKDLINLSPDMHRVIIINFLLLICSLFAIGIFLIPSQSIDTLKKLVKIKKIADLLESFKSIRIKKGQLVELLCWSSLSQLFGISAFHLINLNFYQSSIRLQDIFTIIPMGQTAVVLPISPAGLGVGHLAYAKLFSYFNQTNGATLFNNFWILILLFNVFGIIPYIFLQRVPAKTDDLNL